MKEKKPIFKKWWFWLLIIVIVGGAGSQLGGSGDKENPKKDKEVKKEYYEIGEVVETDKYTFVVNSARVMEANKYAQPAEGKIIYAVDATFTNKADKDANITALNNKIKDSEGRAQDMYIFGDTKGGLGGTVLPNEKLSGEAAFEVDPEGELFFYFETSVIGGDTIKVKVR